MGALYGIYGAGGFGREIMPVARRMLEARREADARLVFIDDVVMEREVNGFPVMRLEAFLTAPATERRFNVSVADSAARRSLAARCIDGGARPFDVLAGDRVCYEPNEVGEGAVICAYTIITANARIGRFFHANLYSYVAHDCVIGDFVTFAPGVHCNGNVVVEDDAYVGTGVVIRNGSRGNPVVIGKGAVVGMGAVVTKSVAPGATVMGNPAREGNRQ